MLVFQRCVLIAVIPMNLLCLAWVWFGRGLFGVLGWMLLMLLFALPFLFIALLLTTVLAFAQRRGRLTTGQTIAHLTLWTAMVGFGGFLVDAGDTRNSEASVLTQVIGRSDTTLAVSGYLALACAITFIGSYLWLLRLLIVGFNNRPKPPSKLGRPPRQ